MQTLTAPFLGKAVTGERLPVCRTEDKPTLDFIRLLWGGGPLRFTTCFSFVVAHSGGTSRPQSLPLGRMEAFRASTALNLQETYMSASSHHSQR